MPARAPANINRHYVPVDKATRFAALLSIGTGLLLEFAWISYCYSNARSGVVCPKVYQYLLLLFFGVPLFGGGLIILLGAARVLLNRSISIRTHVKLSAVAIILGLATGEAWIGAQDLMLLRSPPPAGEWQQRWFPFGFKKIAYNPATGKYVSD